MQWILDHRIELLDALLGAITIELISSLLAIFCVRRVNRWFRAAFPDVAQQQRLLTPHEEKRWELIHEEQSHADRVFASIQLVAVLLQYPSIFVSGVVMKRERFIPNRLLNVLVWFGLLFLLTCWL